MLRALIPPLVSFLPRPATARGNSARAGRLAAAAGSRGLRAAHEPATLLLLDLGDGVGEGRPGDAGRDLGLRALGRELQAGQEFTQQLAELGGPQREEAHPADRLTLLLL